MQATRIIGNFDKFTNSFTRYGRNKNFIIQELKDSGFSEFRERTLKDKSQVLLAYKEGKNLAEYAFRLYPNLSMIQKYISKSYALINFPLSRIKINKMYIDPKGKNLFEKSTCSRYLNKKLTEKNTRIWDFKKDIDIIKDELFSPLGENDIIKSYEKRWDGNNYKFTQYANNKRSYYKNIDGIEYSFNSINR